MLTKKSKGLRATGIAAVSCARHQMFRPLGMGDLQKGERYVPTQCKPHSHTDSIFTSQCNMDYLFTSSIKGAGVQLLTISYDVACQWYTHFWTRNNKLPPSLRLNLPTDNVRALVPKFHLQSHTEGCHSPFSFNFFPGGGRTDGEGVERNWDELNGQGPSTSEMLPGSRWDTLDDCAGWVNWRKTAGLGALFDWFHLELGSHPIQVGDLLLKRLLIATPKARRARRDFVEYDSYMRIDRPAEVQAIEEVLAAWQNDRSCPDPYLLPKCSKSLESILQLLY